MDDIMKKMPPALHDLMILSYDHKIRSSLNDSGNIFHFDVSKIVHSYLDVRI